MLSLHQMPTDRDQVRASTLDEARRLKDCASNRRHKLKTEEARWNARSDGAYRLRYSFAHFGNRAFISSRYSGRQPRGLGCALPWRYGGASLPRNSQASRPGVRSRALHARGLMGHAARWPSGRSRPAADYGTGMREALRQESLPEPAPHAIASFGF